MSNTLLLRLEGSLQSWGDHSRHEVRDTSNYPTKSGVLGLVCAAMGLTRDQATLRLPSLAALEMGVRIDRPGHLIADYQSVGAGEGSLMAEPKDKKLLKGKNGDYETLLMRKFFLADAAFLVALRGASALLGEIADALRSPVWPLYLGRRRCLPSTPIFGEEFNKDGSVRRACTGDFASIKEALSSCPVRVARPALDDRTTLPVVLEAPRGRQVWDVPLSFGQPTYGVRHLIDDVVAVDVEMDPLLVGVEKRMLPAIRLPGWSDCRAGADGAPVGRREARLQVDSHRCVCCGEPAEHVHHRTYRRAGNELVSDLCSLCSLCHDACTLQEYAEGMTLDRIDPRDPHWHEGVLALRRSLVEFRARRKQR